MGKATRVVPSNVALAAGSSSSSDSDSGIFRIFGSQNRKLKKDISKWITRNEADFIECRYKDTSAIVYSVVHNVMDNPRANALSANSNSVVKSTQEVNYLLKGTTFAKVSNSKPLLHMNFHAGPEIPLIPEMASQNLAIKRVPATINLHSGEREKMETNKSSMKKKSKGCSLS